MKCAHCEKEIEIEKSHSMTVVLQRVSNEGYSFYQCSEGQENGGLSHQHFHCERDAMIAGIQSCINEHYTEEKLQPVDPQLVRLHKVVLFAGLHCKVCGATLTDKAYRLCLTHATPKNSVPDNSLSDLGEWCCTLDHAKQSSLTTILKEEVL